MADTEVPRERVAPKDDRPASDRFRIPEHNCDCTKTALKAAATSD